jgi:hypothetical protein
VKSETGKVQQPSTVLVVAGTKINSYSLCIEAAYKRSEEGPVHFLDIDFTPRFLVPSKKRLLRQIQITRPSITFSKLDIGKVLFSFVRQRKELRALYKNLMGFNHGSSVSGEAEFQVMHRLIRSLQARTIGTADFDLREANSRHMKILIIHFFLVRHQVRSLVKQLNVSEMVAHGGRDVYSAAVVVVAKQQRIPFRLLEAGGSPGRWKEFATSPHWSPEWWEMLEGVNVEVVDDESVEEWWRSRLDGVDWISDRNWGETRKEGSLPAQLPDQFVAFFSTSEFELPAFSFLDPNFGDFKSQMSAVKTLLSVCEEKNIPLVIRRHPNSLGAKGIDKEMTQWLEVSTHPLVTYVSPEDNVDSISLLRRAKFVFTYRSSIGIEAMYVGRPSYAMSAPRWAKDLECRAWSRSDIQMILENNRKWWQGNSDLPRRWATLMLTMGDKNEIFKEIHGSISVVNNGNYAICYSQIAQMVSAGINRILIGTLRD